MDSLRTAFIGPSGIRAGWRFLLYAALALGIGGAMQFAALRLAGYQPREGWNPQDFLFADGFGFIGALAATAIMARIEGTRVGEYGLPLTARVIPQLGAGIGIGLAMVAVLCAAIAAAGGLSVDGLALHGPALARSAIIWALVMMVLGLYEEFLFRGYALSALTSGLGFWPAAILLSAFFGGLHYFTKPFETVIDALNVGLLGLWLCVTRRRTGSLWLAVGFHAAFDYAALIIAGAPNTGNGGKPVDDHLLATHFHGPDWLTGGVTGI